jgi:hypothetical protein
MTTKRRKLTAQRIGLSSAALEAWRGGDLHALNRELGVRPWMISPFDAGSKPSIGAKSEWASSWPRAAGLRAALIEAAGPPGRVGRHGQPLGPATNAD